MSYEIRSKERALIAGGFRTISEALRSAQANPSAHWVTKTTISAVAVRDGNGVNGAFIAPNEWPGEGDWT